MQWLLVGVGQYYYDVWCMCVFGQVFGMVGEWYVCIVDCVFLQWCGDDCVVLVCQCVVDCCVEQFEYVVVVCCVEFVCLCGYGQCVMCD